MKSSSNLAQSLEKITKINRMRKKDIFSKIDQVVTDSVAEQLARLFIEQLELEHNKEKGLMAIEKTN